MLKDQYTYTFYIDEEKTAYTDAKLRNHVGFIVEDGVHIEVPCHDHLEYNDTVPYDVANIINMHTPDHHKLYQQLVNVKNDDIRAILAFLLKQAIKHDRAIGDLSGGRL
jgi:hypothetical protein